MTLREFLNNHNQSVSVYYHDDYMISLTKAVDLDIICHDVKDAREILDKDLSELTAHVNLDINKDIELLDETILTHLLNNYC